jgi:uncharacterized repeat protein (TIGR03803 family)
MKTPRWLRLSAFLEPVPKPRPSTRFQTQRLWSHLTARLLLVLLSVTIGPRVGYAGVHYQRLKSFGSLVDLGDHPSAPLVQGSDGALYGTTSEGGAYTNRSKYGYIGLGTVFRLNKDGRGYSLLHSFGSSGDGWDPQARLLEGSDGVLYGTTPFGGAYTNGTVFKLHKDGTGYALLHSFSSAAGGSAFPQAALVEGSDGALYGMAGGGGANNAGILFKLNKDASGYTILRTFGTSAADGQGPSALLPGSDGALYGTTTGGGTYNAGTVFRLNDDGSGYSILRSFGSSGVDGRSPLGLLQASDGALYGTTSGGGAYTDQNTNGLGTMFKLNKDGSGYTILHSFTNIDEVCGWRGRLIEGSDGAFYGTTECGGSNYVGTVFRLNKDGSVYTVLHNFDGYDGYWPEGVVEASDGALYGTSFQGGPGPGTIFKMNADGSSVSVIHTFGSTISGFDGLDPEAPLIEGSDGAIYGTTASGGTNDSGTVFKLNRDGSGYNVLHSFGSIGGDGQNPYDRLVEGSDGVLYGTTAGGGTNNSGTVFKLDKDGSGYTVLYNFAGRGFDGYDGGLVEAIDGALYGTTTQGGTTNAKYPSGCGIVFMLNKDGSGYTVLHGFSGYDGWAPYAGLVAGSDGALYGTTYSGGTSGDGTVFKLNIDGSGFRVMRIFNSGSGFDGEGLEAGLLEGSDGALYGTTQSGSANTFPGNGTVFKLNKDGSGYSILHSFGSTADDALSPFTGLVEGPDGALYGTTEIGGSNDSGTVYGLNKDGSGYTVLYNFGSGGGDGAGPLARLVKGSDGALYGTTPSGGDSGSGTVFRVWPPETPDMIGVSTVGNARQVIFAGLGGYHYQVLRSTDLRSWLLLTNVTMPPVDIYTNVDNTPLLPAAYYRVAWVP